MNLTSHSILALATDLDGTLIPLDDHPQNRKDLDRLENLIEQYSLQLVFVTGRHPSSVEDAIELYDLPFPDWVICDVGTTLLHRNPDQSLTAVDAYQQQLAALAGSLPLSEVERHLKKFSQIRKQELEKQGHFKLSYYADQSDLQSVVQLIENELSRMGAPYSIIASVDPFNGDGLIDLLPSGVSKAFALSWWSDFQNLRQESIVFSGDSGNDLAALIAGYPAILVENASEKLIEKVEQTHREQGWSDRLFIASEPATSGVLAGLQHYLNTEDR